MNVARELPDAITPATLPEMQAAFARAWPELNAGGVLLLLAHWHVETGGVAMHCWNVGNAKGIPGDGRSWTFFRCSEIIGGHEVFFDPPHPQTRFRAFETLAEGVADYVRMIRSTFARALPALVAGDPIRYAVDLHLARYYTADVGRYAAGICARADLVSRELGVRSPSADSVALALAALGFQCVRSYQASRGLAVDGVAGPATIGAIAHELEAVERRAAG